MSKSILKEKSFKFAIRIVKLSQFLNEKKEFVLSKQILRSGTAIGALVREANYAESKADFIHKLKISLKEASETEYWLELLYETNYLEQKLKESLILDLTELLKLLTASINTIRKQKN